MRQACTVGTVGPGGTEAAAEVVAGKSGGYWLGWAEVVSLLMGNRGSGRAAGRVTVRWACRGPRPPLAPGPSASHHMVNMVQAALMVIDFGQTASLSRLGVVDKSREPWDLGIQGTLAQIRTDIRTLRDRSDPWECNEHIANTRANRLSTLPQSFAQN